MLLLSICRVLQPTLEVRVSPHPVGVGIDPDSRGSVQADQSSARRHLPDLRSEVLQNETDQSIDQTADRRHPYT